MLSVLGYLYYFFLLLFFNIFLIMTYISVSFLSQVCGRFSVMSCADYDLVSLDDLLSVVGRHDRGVPQTRFPHSTLDAIHQVPQQIQLPAVIR